MGHQHEHHHDHHHEITSLNKAFIIGISLNLVFVVAEFLAGFWYNSLGLLSGRCGEPGACDAGFPAGEGTTHFPLYIRI